MIDRIFSYSYIVFIALTSLGFFVIALMIYLVTFLFDRRLALLHLFSSFWASCYIWCMPSWSVTIRGRENLDWEKSYILVSNHQSQLDILVAYGLFYPFKWVSKAEVFNLPVIGWNMRLNGYIQLKRGNKDSVRTMMRTCERHLAQGCSIFFFPEGTRSRTGEIGVFKPGAFILAKKMKCSIIPIAINGTINVLPKNTLVFHGRHQMDLTVLDEIPFHEFQALEPEKIAQMVREKISLHVVAHQVITENSMLKN